ncbi:anthranilate phosphoribosyltransferase [candidate division KSB1 bacterium]|nr:anthranilate phosphoribosyltransferase [candidate division KSB1 bacterium]NIR68947.1 anthranilate phosphoribosyltransferase [candidate division KSB1 bacterium]NIS27284.1 anthranilate phosphoribosyltransferase [candidate division KSB1 bacterium]NIT74163.1 anthranilate phosphoribosyltransferase [candidate division KSB1 bacterium]NIU28014.1 anthranilate phosphoribosyltransferase [candidate division KSB1 bacterium]
MIQEAIKTVIEGGDLSRKEAHAVMSAIMNGEATPAQIAAFIVGAKLKGETQQEVTGFAQAMREKATSVVTKHADAIDMCGTGGDGIGTFNISTVASFVVAAAGVPVAKHGNRSVSSKCGSADLLEALGVNIELDAETTGRCLDEIGIAFLFAPSLHKAMKHAVGPRREIGVRTVFNILGPLTNPAGVKRQVLGVYHRSLCRLMAEVLRELGADHIVIIHSEDGLDEISIQAPTHAVELRDGKLRETQLLPENFGLSVARENGMLGGTPEDNAEIALNILQGERGSNRDIVIANAACGLLVGAAARTFEDGAKMALDSIDSGAALEKLESLREFSQSV